MFVSYRTRLARDLKERIWEGKVVWRLMDLMQISETRPLLEQETKAHLHGLLWVGSHEENRAEEREESKDDSHARRAVPSWFRPETGRSRSATDKNEMARKIAVGMLKQSSLSLLLQLLLKHL